MKKIRNKMMVSLMLVFALFFQITANSVQAADDVAVPYLNNTMRATTSVTIKNGVLHFNNQCAGFSNLTTRIRVTSQIERKAGGLLWTTVDTGTPNNQWVDTVYGYDFNKAHSFKLPSKGTYRVVAIFRVSGSGGPDDVIRNNAEKTY